MGRRSGASVAVLTWFTLTAHSLGAQATPASRETTALHVCSILTAAEVAKYITRGREMMSQPDEMAGLCDYGASWAQVLVYSGPDADAQFDRLLKSFKKDKETRYPLASLGPDGWVMYPRPDNEYQSIGAFTHAKVGPHVVSVFVDADSGKPAESAKSNAEALTKIVLSRLH